MRVGCVLTTINVPRVLALYAKHAPDVMFFVVGDRKTDDMAVVNFLTDNVSNHAYYGIDTQHKLGYKCSRLIGENCIQRRNIGFLEALRWGAEWIVSLDDDNISLSDDYFGDFRRVLCNKHGLEASSSSGWFDVGTLLRPNAEHRGFPHTKRAQPSFDSIVDAKIGVAAGICLGDPDISAVERIANGPTVHGVSEVLRSGVVTDPRKTWTVFNSQNTAVIRELVPAWFMLPHVGRYDDIFASLIVQRIMRETGHHVHFGHPFVWQQRNQHDLTKDLRMELMGMQQIEALTTYLSDLVLYGATTPEHLRQLYFSATMLPSDTIEAALAWCDDCERVL